MKVVEVAAGLVFERGRLLIAQRHPEAHLGGLWEFPGGKREPEESYEDCLARELREELGIEVAVGRELEAITHEYAEKKVHLRFFRCRLIAGDPKPLGCPAFKWVSRPELDEHEFPAADARLLDLLRQEHSLWEECDRS